MNKLIVVDDSDLIRSAVRRALVNAGLEVFEASDGLAGFELVKEHKDALAVIVDYNMPRLNGEHMAARITAEIPDFEGKIIMLTTETDFELKKRGKAAGVKYWMNKPIDEARLTSVIRKLESRR